MKSYILPILLICVICVFSTQILFAQNNNQENKPILAWINLGYGVVGGNGLIGVGLVTNGQYDSKIGLLGLRYFIAGNTGNYTGFSNYINEISELSVTYGYSHNFGIVNFSASTGIGALWGEEGGPGGYNSFRTATFPVQGSIILQPVPIIGLGVMLSTTVNSQSSISGAHFVLQLGRLR